MGYPGTGLCCLVLQCLFLFSLRFLVPSFAGRHCCRRGRTGDAVVDGRCTGPRACSYRELGERARLCLDVGCSESREEEVMLQLHCEGPMRCEVQTVPPL